MIDIGVVIAVFVCVAFGDLEGYSKVVYLALGFFVSIWVVCGRGMVRDCRGAVRAIACIGLVVAISTFHFVCASVAEPISEVKLAACLAFFLVLGEICRARGSLAVAGAYGFVGASLVHVGLATTQYLGDGSRAVGLTSNPNQVGLMAVLSVVICTVWLRPNVLWHLLMLGLLYWVSVITGSRKVVVGAIMLFAGACAVKASVSRRGRLGVALVLTGLVLAGTFLDMSVFMQAGSGVDRLGLILADRSDGGSFRERVELGADGAAVFADNLWVGVGLDVTATTNSLGLYYHNNYLELAVGTGILGLVAYYYWKIQAIAFWGRRSSWLARSYGALAFFTLLAQDVGAVTYDARHVYIALALLPHFGDDRVVRLEVAQ